MLRNVKVTGKGTVCMFPIDIHFVNHNALLSTTARVRSNRDDESRSLKCDYFMQEIADEGRIQINHAQWHHDVTDRPLTLPSDIRGQMVSVAMATLELDLGMVVNWKNHIGNMGILGGYHISKPDVRFRDGFYYFQADDGNIVGIKTYKSDSWEMYDLTSTDVDEFRGVFECGETINGELQFTAHVNIRPLQKQIYYNPLDKWKIESSKGYPINLKQVGYRSTQFAEWCAQICWGHSYGSDNYYWGGLSAMDLYERTQ